MNKRHAALKTNALTIIPPCPILVAVISFFKCQNKADESTLSNKICGICSVHCYDYYYAYRNNLTAIYNLKL